MKKIVLIITAVALLCLLSVSSFASNTQWIVTIHNNLSSPITLTNLSNSTDLTRSCQWATTLNRETIAPGASNTEDMHSFGGEVYSGGWDLINLHSASGYYSQILFTEGIDDNYSDNANVYFATGQKIVSMHLNGYCYNPNLPKGFISLNGTYCHIGDAEFSAAMGFQYNTLNITGSISKKEHEFSNHIIITAAINVNSVIK